MPRIIDNMFEHPFITGILVSSIAGGICQIVRCVSREHQKSKMTPNEIIQYEAVIRGYNTIKSVVHDVTKTGGEFNGRETEETGEGIIT